MNPLKVLAMLVAFAFVGCEAQETPEQQLKAKQEEFTNEAVALHARLKERGAKFLLVVEGSVESVNGRTIRDGRTYRLAISFEGKNVSDEDLANVVKFDQNLGYGVAANLITPTESKTMVRGVQILNLNKTPVSESAIPHLKKLNGLSQLMVQETRFTLSGADALKQAIGRTGTHIIFDASLALKLKQLEADRLTPSEKVAASMAKLGFYVRKVPTSDGTLVTQLTGAKEKAGDDGLAQLKTLPTIRSLQLQGCRKISDRGLAHLRGLFQLQSIDLTGTHITNAGLEHLKDLQLRSLTLSDTAITDQGLAYLQGMHSLKSLSLPDGITDTGLARLRGLKNLRILTIPQARGITDSGLANLKGMTHLSFLALSEAGRVTDSGLVHLKGLTSLSILWLGGTTRVSDAGLVHLGHLPGLEILSLHGASVVGPGLAYLNGSRTLKDLDLSYSRLTDAGLQHVGKMQALTKLDLQSTSITDAGLLHLSSLSNLKELHLSDTNVTKVGKLRLKASLSNCRIE